MAGFKFEVGIDASRYKAGTEDMASATEDLVRELADLERSGSADLDDLARKWNDVADAAQDAGKDTGREFADGVDKATREADTLERKYRDAFDSIDDGSRRASRSMGDNLDRGADRAKDAADEVKDSGREAAASFSGSFDDIGDFVQESLVNAGAVAGPLGLALGVAAGAGAGTFFTMWSENAEKTEERVRSMFEDMAASGDRFLSRSFVTDELQKIITSADDAVISYEKLIEIAERSGVAEETLANAFAGDAEAQAEAIAGVDAAIEDMYERYGDTVSWDQATRRQLSNLRTIRGDLVAQGDQIDATKEKIDVYNRALDQIPDSVRTEVRAGIRAGDPERIDAALEGMTAPRAVTLLAQMALEQVQAEANRVARMVNPPTIPATLGITSARRV